MFLQCFCSFGGPGGNCGGRGDVFRADETSDKPLLLPVLQKTPGPPKSPQGPARPTKTTKEISRAMFTSFLGVALLWGPCV